MLTELYAHLAKAPDADQAAEISKTIEGLWLHSGSDTIGVLMRRGLKAVERAAQRPRAQDVRCRRRACARLCGGLEPPRLRLLPESDTEHAVGDLRRALALDPNHYKALDGLAQPP